jgi:adenylate cyclase class IV
VSGGDGTRELELKAVVPDAAALAARLAKAGAKCTFRGIMRDRRYDLADGSLVARDEVLRVRTFEPFGVGAGPAHAELTWKGPTRRTGGYKEREELQFGVGDAATAGEVLARLGFALTDAIDRCVEYHEVAGAVVRVEWYPRMDVLVEVEGEPETIERAVVATGIPRGEFNADRLLDFAARYRERTGKEPVLRIDRLGANETPGFPGWAGRQ